MDRAVLFQVISSTIGDGESDHGAGGFDGPGTADELLRDRPDADFQSLDPSEFWRAPPLMATASSPVSRRGNLVDIASLGFGALVHLTGIATQVLGSALPFVLKCAGMSYRAIPLLFGISLAGVARIATALGVVGLPPRPCARSRDHRHYPRPHRPHRESDRASRRGSRCCRARLTSRTQVMTWCQQRFGPRETEGLVVPAQVPDIHCRDQRVSRRWHCPERRSANWLLVGRVPRRCGRLAISRHSHFGVSGPHGNRLPRPRGSRNSSPIM